MRRASLLVELLTEELPPRGLRELGERFGGGIAAALAKLGFRAADAPFASFATPRRLAVVAHEVSDVQPEQHIERRGPAVAAGLRNGEPTPALLGFARSCGVPVESLERATDGKAEYFVHRTLRHGAPLQEHLATVVEQALKGLPAPKLMRWGNSDVQFIRPAHRLVMLWGNDVVAGRALDIDADRVTAGHRFMGERMLTLDDADGYQRALRDRGRVVASFDERALEIRQLLRRHAGHDRIADEDLIEEVAALVEWPAVYEGRFDDAFLEVPQECLMLTMKANQKYFPLLGNSGRLLNRFLIVSNMEIADPSYIVSGNERVLRARLSDARFFFDQDRRHRLETLVPQLAQVVYHNKLGTQLDRTERIRRVAAAIAAELAGAHDGAGDGADNGADNSADNGADNSAGVGGAGDGADNSAGVGAAGDGADNSAGVGAADNGASAVGAADGRAAGGVVAAARRAAWLCKADLLTGMVGEFPELQGTMGMHYARHDGELETVCRAIEAHYRPRFAGGPLPEDLVGDCVALADKADALVGIYGIGLVPTGDRDPFGLRRAALGTVRILIEHGHAVDVADLLETARAQFAGIALSPSVVPDLLNFLYDRLRSYLREKGHAADEIEAVLALQPRRFDTLTARLEAVRQFRALPAADSLAAANKRIGNILRKSGSGDQIDTSLFREAAERDLYDSMMLLEPQVEAKLRSTEFSQALQILAGLRERVDMFFDKVLVNTEEENVRNNRLGLLTRLNRLMNRVADISRLAG